MRFEIYRADKPSADESLDEQSVSVIEQEKDSLTPIGICHHSIEEILLQIYQISERDKADHPEYLAHLPLRKMASNFTPSTVDSEYSDITPATLIVCFSSVLRSHDGGLHRLQQARVKYLEGSLNQVALKIGDITQEITVAIESCFYIEFH